MTKKLLSLLIALSLATLALAGVKSKKYSVTFQNPTKAGSVKLAPGAYQLQLDGDKATFTDANNKTVAIPVKVKAGKAKFEFTSVEASNKTGEDVIDAISLGGTSTVLEF
jgi:hypothetical protein